MTEMQIKHENFDCPQMGKVVTISWELFVKRVAGVVQEEVPVDFTCNGKSVECGVAVRSGSNESSSWSNCAHPQIHFLSSE